MCATFVWCLQEKPRQRVTLLFGTQTGTAERFSKQLRSELAQRYGETDLAFEVHDIEEYSHEERLPAEKLVFLLLATYGDGEPTDNAATFHAWVTKAASNADKGLGEKLLKVPPTCAWLLATFIADKSGVGSDDLRPVRRV